MTHDEYLEYLKSPEWQQIRAWVLVFWGHRCAICGSRQSIDVHHRTYERLGHELLTDCIALCRECHALFHDQFRYPFIYNPQLGTHHDSNAVVPSL